VGRFVVAGESGFGRVFGAEFRARFIYGNIDFNIEKYGADF